MCSQLKKTKILETSISESSDDSDCALPVAMGEPETEKFEKYKYSFVLEKELAEKKLNPSYSFLVGKKLDEKRLESMVWCVCENCVTSKTVRENVCCGEDVGDSPDDAYVSMLFEKREKLQCITKHEYFIKNITNSEQLDTMISLERIGKNHKTVEKLLESDKNRVYRHYCYKIFVSWVFDRRAYKERIDLPSCVINYIRTLYPSDNYTGFQLPKD